jgi:hypothetical protein
MNKKITQVRLIQRIELPTKRLSCGSFGAGLRNGGLSSSKMKKIRKFASFSYMGSAEFEHGKLVEGFDKLNNCDHESLVLKRIKVLSKSVWVLTNKELEKEVLSTIKKLATVKEIEWKLKVPSYFEKNLKGKDIYNTQGWIDLDNGYMFFVNEKIAKKFLKFSLNR